MMRAGHRPQHKFFLVDLDRRVHRIFIVRIVAALYIEVELRDVRRVDVEIAALEFLIYDEALKLAAYRPHDAAHEAKVREFMARQRDTERAIAYTTKVMDMILGSLSR